MPTAREGLLDAAFGALKSRPWAGVRMVDVAAVAGVSRQTLYNEFGSKEGLAQALVRREIDGYLAGVERALAGAERSGADAGGRLAAVGSWTLRTARANPLVRAVLTGCWGEELPSPARDAAAQPPVETPAELVGKVCDRTVGTLRDVAGGAAGDATGEEWDRVCEAAARLTLSYVVAPSAKRDEMERMVRGLLAGA